MNDTQTLSEKIVEVCRPLWDEAIKNDSNFVNDEDGMTFEEFCLEVEMEFAMTELESIGALVPPLISNQFGNDFSYREEFPDEVTVKITLPTLPIIPVNDAEKRLACAAVNVVMLYDYNGNQKIMAIKTLRTVLTGLGLAEAKWIVENFTPFRDFVNCYGRIPTLEGTYNNYTMV